MPLIDDVVFYGSRVAAGDMDRDKAARLLADASEGLLTVRGARQAIDTWEGVRDRMRALHADVADAMRAAQNGRPVPEHVEANRRARQKARLLRQLRRRNGA
ncbi:hypothetical protein ACFVOR_37380 [Streptomyces sp. NPDC057837]|uniref:hypothetical protein n=1 Tax=Streptomyces sp. NPDC057837 TaxID=3346260 RepID=UPI0036BB6782